MLLLEIMMTNGVWYECQECSYQTNSEYNAMDHMDEMSHEIWEFGYDEDEEGHTY